MQLIDYHPNAEAEAKMLIGRLSDYFEKKSGPPYKSVIRLLVFEMLSAQKSSSKGALVSTKNFLVRYRIKLVHALDPPISVSLRVMKRGSTSEQLPCAMTPEKANTFFKELSQSQHNDTIKVHAV